MPHSALRALCADFADGNSKTARRAQTGRHGAPSPAFDENTGDPQESQTSKEDAIHHPQEEEREKMETRAEEKDRQEPERSEGQELREEAKVSTEAQKKKPGRAFPTPLRHPLRTLFVLGLIALLLLLLLWWFYGLGGGGGQVLPGQKNGSNAEPEQPIEEKTPEIEDTPSSRREFHISFVPSAKDPDEADQLVCYVSWTNNRERRLVKKPDHWEAAWTQDDFQELLEMKIIAWLEDIAASETRQQPIVVVWMKPFPGKGTFDRIKKTVDDLSQRRDMRPPIGIESISAGLE